MTEDRSKNGSGSRPGETAKGPSGNFSGSPKRQGRPAGWVDPLRPQQPLASARWILGSILAVVVLAGGCLYGAVCLLFWQGQWQLIFHPSHERSFVAPIALRYQDIRFDATETGLLQLHGWWIPAEPTGQYAGYTILLLRDGSGSLPDSAAQLRALHALGINALAFDYRGFGASAKLHPSEKSTAEDADAAWNYLTGTRRLSPQTIVLYGDRLGATIAAEAALRHPESPALILEDPQPPALEIFKHNPSLKYLPVRLLFHDRFDPSQTLGRLPVPKLFLDTGGDTGGRLTPLYFDRAAGPKSSAVLDAGSDTSAYQEPGYAAALNGFLGRYLPPRER